MIWLAWLLILLGAAWAWIVLLAGGMSTVPRTSGASALSACVLPGLGLFTGLAANSLVAPIAAGLVLLYVGLGYLSQPNKRGFWGRFLGGAFRRRHSAFAGPRELRVERAPWTCVVRRARAQKDRLLLEVLRDGRRAWKETLPAGGAPTSLCATFFRDQLVVGHAATAIGFEVDGGRRLWTSGLGFVPQHMQPFAGDDGGEVAVVVAGLDQARALRENGSCFWERKLGDFYVSHVRIRDGHIDYVRHDGATRRIRMADGALLMEERAADHGLDPDADDAPGGR